MNTRLSLSSRSARLHSHRMALVLLRVRTAASASASNGPLDIILKPCADIVTTYGSEGGKAPPSTDVIRV